MLVLSRRLDEKILLPSVPAVIKVISSHAGLVRLGVEAPADVPILREELTHNDRGLPLAPADDAPGYPPLEVVRDRVGNLTLMMTLLRSRLPDGDHQVRRLLDGVDGELLALRRYLRSAVEEPHTALVAVA